MSFGFHGRESTLFSPAAFLPDGDHPHTQNKSVKGRQNRCEPANAGKELNFNCFKLEGIAKMAGDKVFLADIPVSRHLVATNLFGILAPGMKVAAGRGIDWTGNIPFKPDPMGLVIGIRDGDGRH